MTTSTSHLAPAGAPLPASAYAREQRMLARYSDLLYGPEMEDVEVLMCRIWGPLTPLQMYGKEGNEGRIDRLDYVVPDLIRLLRPDEQPPVEALLNAGDLPGAIRHLLSQERTLKKREHDPNLKLSDNARTAGLGRLSSESYGKLHPGYQFRLFRMEAPAKAAVKPMLRPKVKKRRPAPHWLRHAQLNLFA